MRKFIPILCLCFSITIQAQNVLFNKTYDFTSFDSGTDLISTQDGNYLVAASNRLLKINPLGDTLWIKLVENFNVFSLVEQNDGSVILCGNVNDSLFTGALMKVNENGDSLWLKRYLHREGLFIRNNVSANGNIFVVGYSDIVPSDSTGTNFWLLKTDSLGNLIYEKLLDIEQNNDAFLDLNVNIDESVLCVGTTNNSGYLAYFDTNGDTVFTQLYPNFTSINDITKTIDSNFVMVGSSNTGGLNQGMITKISPFGIPLWEKWYAKNDAFSFKKVAHIFSDMFLVGGNEVDYSNPNNNSAVFMVLNADGDSLWSEQYQHISTTTRNEMRSMVVTPNQGFMFTGASLVVPNKDVWIMSIDSLDCANFLNGCQTVQVNEVEKTTNNLRFFPNPVNNWLTITSIKNINEVKIEAIDLLGKIVLTESKLPQNETLKINVSSFNNGIYLFKLAFADGTSDVFKVSVNR